ncbi:GtrA family protein [Sessilibacter sp. MAH4]
MQIIKYGLVGAFGTALHYLVLIIFVELMRAPIEIGTSVGFILGAIFNHHFNHKVTFKSEINYRETLWKSFLVACLMFLANLLLMAIFTRVLAINYIVAQVVATGIVFVLGYLLNKSIVFISKKD